MYTHDETMFLWGCHSKLLIVFKLSGDVGRCAPSPIQFSNLDECYIYEFQFVHIYSLTVLHAKHAVNTDMMEDQN